MISLVFLLFLRLKLNYNIEWGVQENKIAVILLHKVSVELSVNFQDTSKACYQLYVLQTTINCIVLQINI